MEKKEKKNFVFQKNYEHIAMQEINRFLSSE